MMKEKSNIFVSSLEKMRIMLRPNILKYCAMLKNNWIKCVRTILIIILVTFTVFGYFIAKETYRILYEPFHGNEISAWDQSCPGTQLFSGPSSCHTRPEIRPWFSKRPDFLGQGII